MDKQQQFHFRDGTHASSLNDLKEKIETISYAEFYHHVNSSKNDFANWVRYVLKDDQLANSLEKTTSIVETVEVMNDYLHPRAHHVREDDIQERIEDQLGIDAPEPTTQELEEVPAVQEPLPAQEDVQEPLAVEEKVQTPPAVQETVLEPMLADESPSFEDFYEQKEEPVQQSAQEEQTQQVQQSQQEDAKDSLADKETHHYRVDKQEKKELKEFHHNLDKIIIKDFIWGLIFGLIIGFVLARMLTL